MTLEARIGRLENTAAKEGVKFLRVYFRPEFGDYVENFFSCNGDHGRIYTREELDQLEHAGTIVFIVIFGE